jgi:hypothetical protein
MGMSIDRYNERLFLGYLNNSYQDYIAARIIINKGLLLQGVILSHTSIEKLLKAVRLFFSKDKWNELKNRKHNLDLLLDDIRHLNQDLYNRINLGFIRNLNRIYDARYFDSIKPGYGLRIYRKHLLHELDGTYKYLYSFLKIDLNTRYISDIKENNADLYENNHTLTNVFTDEYLSKNDIVYELQCKSDTMIAEMHYEI